jgi:hypothetical protein
MIMKTPYLFVVTISLTFVCSVTLVRGEDLSIPKQIEAAQAAGSITNLLAISKKIETLWPTNAGNYFQYQNQLSAALQPLCSSNAMAGQILVQQTGMTLAKKCPNDISIVEGCFSAKEAIMGRIAKVTESAPTLRIAQMMAKTVGEVRSAIIPNYHWVFVTANVAPPVFPTTPLKTNEIRVFFSGMGADAISDPVARAAYIKACAENGSNNIQNGLQLDILPQINQAMISTFLNYSKNAFAHDPGAKNHINDLAASAHLTEEERQQLQ